MRPIRTPPTAWQDVDSSFERFCLTAGIGAIEQTLCEDAQQLAGAPHSRGGGRVGHRWGRTKGKIGFHGGKVAVHRPRVRGADRQSPRSPSKAPALARLHQLKREHDGDRAPRLSQREAMAKCRDGAALDGRWNDGSG